MTSDKKNQGIPKRIGEKVCANPPKVSVIIPAYNIAKYISETLDSALSQTFKDFEIIVINDGSPDTIEFENVLASYFEEIVYLSSTNIGAGAARNVAIDHSRGELLAFLDGDDIWLPDFLKSQVEFLEKNKFDLVYADADLFGDSALAGKTYMQTSPSVGEATFEALLDGQCSVITSGVVTRKKLVLEAGMFEQERVRAHDFHLWLRMLKKGARIGYQKKVLLKYRIHVDSLSGDSAQQIQREIDVYHRVEKMIKLDENQSQIVNRQINRLEAEMEIERGKSFLLAENFAAAKESFKKGNQHHKSYRLQLIIWSIQIAPQLILKLYRTRRPDEIAFASHNKKQLN